MPSSQPYNEVMIEHYRAHPDYARELLREAITNWSYEELSLIIPRIAQAFPYEAEPNTALAYEDSESPSQNSLVALLARVGLEVVLTPARQQYQSEVVPQTIMEPQAA